jgi:hypothetical protein
MVEKSENHDALLRHLRESHSKKVAEGNYRSATALESPHSVVERRAASRKKSVEDLFDEDAARFEAMGYPGTDCFEPFEVEQYTIGALPPDRLAHVERCRLCAALLEMTSPTDDRVAEFLREIREAIPVDTGLVVASTRSGGLVDLGHG